MPAVDLRAAVATRARIQGELILVDEFLNHRVEPELISTVGRDLAIRLEPVRPDVILTAEASGIPVALPTAIEMGIPMVYAKKYLGVGKRHVFAREVKSATKGIEYRVEVSRSALSPGSRVAVVDDFLSGGRTAEALGEIAEEAGCEVVACFFAIEKAYEPGRGRLENHGWEVDALVRVLGVGNGRVTLAEQ